MTNLNFKAGQQVSYTNGSPSMYTGQIVKVKQNTLIVIDDNEGMELWNAGFAVGSEIAFEQVKAQ
jgi:hypothetical protein